MNLQGQSLPGGTLDCSLPCGWADVPELPAELPDELPVYNLKVNFQSTI
jgi:hypothetical protein